MARLASQEKMGFYPTPPVVVEQIRAMLRISPNARLLDTCCGKGDALSIIGKEIESKTYGVELDHERFLEAANKLDHVLWADSCHELICSKGAFSFLWLNPPYDTEEQQGEKTEFRFLERHWPYLEKGGVLVYIIPKTSLDRASTFLKTRCRSINVLSFPADYYWDFKQVVVIAQKGRPRRLEAERNLYILETAVKADPLVIPDILPTTEDRCLDIDVPPSRLEKFNFRSIRLNPDDVLDKVKASRLWVKACKYLFSGADRGDIQPLVPLREGHLAMLLASGMMNGEVVGNNGQRLIVKGSVRKGCVETMEETEKGVKHIRTDRYEIVVKAISFNPVEIMTIA